MLPEHVRHGMEVPMQWQAFAVLLVVVVLGSASDRQRIGRWIPGVLLPWLRIRVSGADRLRRAIIRRAVWEVTAAGAESGRVPDEVCVAVAPVDAARLAPRRAAVEAE